MPAELEKGRIRTGSFGSDATFGFNGASFVRGPCGAELKIVASDGTVLAEEYPWEHVSVSLKNRCPNWPEMSFVKSLFWDDEEAVMQLHPPKSEYVNYHPFCLHLWKPTGVEIPLPPAIMVGPKTGGAA